MREIPSSRLRSPSRSQRQRGPGVPAEGRPNRRSCFCVRALTEPKGLFAGESWGYEAIVHTLPKTSIRQALRSRERKVTSSGRRQQKQRLWTGAGIPAHPREIGVLEAPGNTLWPPEIKSIPSTRSPVSRRELSPWAQPAGLSALSPAVLEMLLRAGWTQRFVCPGSAGGRRQAARLGASPRL